MDQATPNLPSRDFSQTLEFYQRLGFEEDWRDDGWMIVRRGSLKLEFFPFSDLDPLTSAFSCCLRLDAMTDLYRIAKSAGILERCWGFPRLHAPALEESGLTIAYLVDCDGSLLRLIQNS